jgi:hypothetical protein
MKIKILVKESNKIMGICTEKTNLLIYICLFYIYEY